MNFQVARIVIVQLPAFLTSQQFFNFSLINCLTFFCCLFNHLNLVAGQIVFNSPAKLAENYSDINLLRIRNKVFALAASHHTDCRNSQYSHACTLQKRTTRNLIHNLLSSLWFFPAAL